MVNLLGAFIIVLGFISPFLIHLPSGIPIPPTILFWVGFLLLLKSSSKLMKLSPWLKWGRIGLLANIAGLLLLFLISEALLNTSLLGRHGFLLLKGASFIIHPIASLSEILFPYEQIKMSDGSIGTKISYLRSTITSFLDILLFIGIAIIIEKLFFAKHNREERI